MPIWTRDSNEFQRVSTCPQEATCKKTAQPQSTQLLTIACRLNDLVHAAVFFPNLINMPVPEISAPVLETFQ